ncbi:hypothetical protein EC988_006293 [Linderina pennispora]|nr:hypothetical protein EC988_006293 [Linderina pennispora]
MNEEGKPLNASFLSSSVGQVVCSDCNKNKWYLPKYGLSTPASCCTTCDRNLRLSIRSKSELEQCAIRDLRLYLQLYGLYNPRGMLEKTDLVAAIYNHSPMPQMNEVKYRNSLPRPSAATHRQEQPRGSSGNWDQMFSSIGEDIGRGMANIGQQFESLFDEDQSRRSHGGGTYQHVPAYDSNTFPRSRPAHPRQPPRQQPPPEPQSRPRSAQGPAQPAAQPAARPATQPATRPRSQPAKPAAKAVVIPEIKDLVSDNTDVSTLSAKQLKLLLHKHRVDYTHIVEKHELVERVERLVANTRLEMGRESNDNDLCKICWDEATNCVFLNCGHMCTCLECGEQIFKSERKECPICREHIARIVHVFRA